MDASRAPVVSEPSRRLAGVSDDRSRTVTRWRLLAASTLMLFLELALIRWLGANVVHLGVLLELRAARVVPRRRPGVPASSRTDRRTARCRCTRWWCCSAGRLRQRVSGDGRPVERRLIFFTSLGTTGPPIWVMLPGVFLAVAAVLAGPGEIVGACFRQLPRLEAYRFDLLGSLAGIAAFTLLSFPGAPPLVWFVIVAVLFVVLLGRRRFGDRSPCSSR